MPLFCSPLNFDINIFKFSHTRFYCQQFYAFLYTHLSSFLAHSYVLSVLVVTYCYLLSFTVISQPALPPAGQDQDSGHPPAGLRGPVHAESLGELSLSHGAPSRGWQWGDVWGRVPAAAALVSLLLSTAPSYQLPRCAILPVASLCFPLSCLFGYPISWFFVLATKNSCPCGCIMNPRGQALLQCLVARSLVPASPDLMLSLSFFLTLCCFSCLF